MNIRKKKKKKKLLIISGIVIIFLLVAGAFWIGRVNAKNSLPEKNAPNQPKDSSQPRKPKNPPYNNFPTNPNELQFTVYYFVELGRNHMWIERNDDRVILIGKENPIFPNSELTKKNHNCTITFLAPDAEKYHNQDHVYYFSKNNDKFTLKPELD